jgi:hypothetical protein
VASNSLHLSMPSEKWSITLNAFSTSSVVKSDDTLHWTSPVKAMGSHLGQFHPKEVKLVLG